MDEFSEDVPGNNKRLKRKLKQAIKDEYSESEDESDSEKLDENNEVEENNKKVDINDGNDDAATNSDDDSDMFASDEEPEVEQKVNEVKNEYINGNGKKSKVKQLDMAKFYKDAEIEETGDIEDQDEVQYDNYNEVQDYYNNIEDFDETKTRKQKLAPKMDSFNLEKENADGTFDDDGNFIRNKDDEGEEEDEEWIKSANNETIRMAKTAQLERQKLINEKNKDTVPIRDLLSKLINVLEPDETPMESLSRYTPKKTKTNRRGKSSSSQVDKKKDKSRKETVNLITDVCDKLMTQKGILEVYDLVREELMRNYKAETGEDFHPDRGLKRQLEESDEVEQSEPVDQDDDYGEKVWQFKWEGLDEINGPYSEYEIKYWKESYFENKVFIKKIDQENFTHISEIEFD